MFIFFPYWFYIEVEISVIVEWTIGVTAVTLWKQFNFAFGDARSVGSEREFRYEIAKEQKQGIQVSVRRTDKKLKNNKNYKIAIFINTDLVQL